MNGGKGSRAPFITSLIHENNFYRCGPESWTLVYYQDRDKKNPLSPPFNLNAPDQSTLRSKEEQEKIWQAYEEMVAYAGSHLKVMTSEDIVALAQQDQVRTRPHQKSPKRAIPDTLEQSQDISYCPSVTPNLKLDLLRLKDKPTKPKKPAPLPMYRLMILHF